jgi:UDP-N-acetylglucosamine--N-acetylmuramyl-(pentapeptide) pyrophosphoryl-undecaprenol N-acetylglucosamine transferase
VRDEFWTTSRESARERLGLPRDASVLLVTAGSLGARKINQAIWPALPQLLDRCVVLHVTGAADEAAAIERRAQLAPEQQRRYVVHGYLDAMPAAMIAADLVISRSGASTLGELPAAGAPAVLVPGEYEGWTQAPNAEFLEAEGGAVMLRNAELDRLASTTLELLADGDRRANMRAAMQRLARPDAAERIARILQEVAA